MILTPPISLLTLLPEIVLLVAACGVLIIGQERRAGLRQLAPWAALGALIAALVLVLRGVGEPAAGVAASGLYFGGLARFVRVSALELGILLVLVNWAQGRREERGEFLAMLLLSLTGLLLVAPADNLAILFLALELVSIPTYVLVVLGRQNPLSAEAGTKYFYLGAMSAALMAFGFSFLYGVTGSLDLTTTLDGDGAVVSLGVVAAVTQALGNPGSIEFGIAIVGIALSFAGLLFKIAAFPLHLYVADVYQGAASPVAGLLGFVPKIAGFVALFKIIQSTGQWQYGETLIFWLIWLTAALSMTVGNLLALRQTNIKRLLAYSGIAHAGYMLVGLLAGPFAGKMVSSEGIGNFADGTAAVLYYVVIYGIANLGAFAVLGLLHFRERPCETLREVAGLIRNEPALALLLVLAMFTLMGMPPTPGFWGKFSLFGSALAASNQSMLPDTYRTWLLVLVIIAVLNSAIAAAYYLRVIGAVLFFEPEETARAEQREAPQIGALLCGFLLIIFSFYPGGLFEAGRQATVDLERTQDRIPGVVRMSTSVAPPPLEKPLEAPAAADSYSPS
ncbi:MAG: NADH-quinone oxidoreductase subunit N [Phycisphaerales bacterium]|nr:NADH-quinone oxidoreductase subunit N [Phycisphaerales bacterium]